MPTTKRTKRTIKANIRYWGKQYREVGAKIAAHRNLSAEEYVTRDIAEENALIEEREDLADTLARLACELVEV